MTRQKVLGDGVVDSDSYTARMKTDERKMFLRYIVIHFFFVFRSKTDVNVNVDLFM
jgi:hypothetical protein